MGHTQYKYISLPEHCLVPNVTILDFMSSKINVE